MVSNHLHLKQLLSELTGQHNSDPTPVVTHVFTEYSDILHRMHLDFNLPSYYDALHQLSDDLKLIMDQSTEEHHKVSALYRLRKGLIIDINHLIDFTSKRAD